MDYAPVTLNNTKGTFKSMSAERDASSLDFRVAPGYPSLTTTYIAQSKFLHADIYGMTNKIQNYIAYAIINRG